MRKIGRKNDCFGVGFGERSFQVFLGLFGDLLGDGRLEEVTP